MPQNTHSTDGIPTGADLAGVSARALLAGAPAVPIGFLPFSQVEIRDVMYKPLKVSDRGHHMAQVDLPDVIEFFTHEEAAVAPGSVRRRIREEASDHRRASDVGSAGAIGGAARHG